MRRLLDAGVDGDVMATSKYLGTSDPRAVQHSSNVVVVNGPRGRALFSVALSRIGSLVGREAPTPDQPALMVALRAVGVGRRVLESVALSFTEASPDLVCRANLASTTLLLRRPCAVVHKPAKHRRRARSCRRLQEGARRRWSGF